MNYETSFKIEILKNIRLAPYTGFKIGGPAKFFCVVKQYEELLEALEFSHQKNLNYFILGSGTNILVPDLGFSGVVIKNQIRNKSFEDGLLIASTGITLAELFLFGHEYGLVGFEALATVPGTLGGAIYNNAHYGESLLSDFVEWVEVLQDGQLVRMQKQELSFAYDSSVIKTNKLPAVRAALRLPKGDVSLSKKTFLELLKKRGQNQPYGTFNAGCIFQNTPKILGPGNHGTSAGWLIEQVGLKGKCLGGIKVSEKHGNFFVNNGTGTANEILNLIQLCKQEVFKKFEVHLETEIKIL